MIIKKNNTHRKKNIIIYNKQAQTEKPKNEQAQGRTDFETAEHGHMTKVVCIIAPLECYSGLRYFQLTTKYSNDRCPNPVYFNSPLFLICL